MPQAKRALPLVLGGLCVWLLWHEASRLDPRAVVAELSYIAPWRWVAALAATALSFAAIAHYDVVAHRHLNTGTAQRAARRAGAGAIAIGQFTGFGPVVGAAVRWRLLPAMGHGGVVKLTAFVTLSFIAAWVFLSLTMALPAAFGHPWLALVTLLPALAAAVWLLLRVPHVAILGQRLRLPSLPAAARLAVLTFADLFFAGIALALLLPEGAGPVWQIAGIFTLALGAGLIGGTPGGIGPFELTLAAFLPHVAPPALAAALLAFRLIYYLVPLGCGVAYLLIARTTHVANPRVISTPPPVGPRAEHQILAQNASRRIDSACAEAHGPLVLTPHAAMLFLGPQHGPIQPLLAPLKVEAKAENRVACLYKLSPRDAVHVRRAGWIVMPFASEAFIDPQHFTLNTPERRQLRRVLRKAESAGVTLSRPAVPDWPALSEINEAWAHMHGGERGLTMGRFCPAYLEQKPIFVASQHGDPIAFVSFVTAPGVMSLDIMRHRPDLPPGTMQALMITAINAARNEGLHEVNLAALPHGRFDRFAKGTEGLRRFKSAFGPSWRHLYIAAPDPLSLTVAAADIWHTIRRPEPLAPLSADWVVPQDVPEPGADAPIAAAASGTGFADDHPLRADPARAGNWISQVPEAARPVMPIDPADGTDVDTDPAGLPSGTRRLA